MSNTISWKTDETEIGDRALCRILEIDYENEYLKLEISERLELSKQNLTKTLEELILNIREEKKLIPNELLSVFVYNTKFTPEHLMNCDCYRTLVNRFMDIQAMEEVLNKESSNYKLNENTAEKRAVFYKLQDIRKSSAEKAASFLNNSLLMVNQVRICPYLYQELTNTISIFDKDYDLSKIKIREIVKSIINYQISLYNSNLDTSYSGMFERASDKFGNTITKVSQSEYYKTRLNAEIIKAIKTLDEMVEGNKNVNLNVNIESIRLKDVLKQINLENCDNK